MVWFTAMSMDGKLAAAGDSLAFLDSIRDQELEASDFPRFLDSVDAVVVAAHGSSGADAVANGVRVTRELAQLDLVNRLRAALASADVPQSGTNSLGGLMP